tara:strand:+ start:995 stop:2068 length:1074 start_codon:yes stop_codon:yes gene_type:complete
MDRFHNLDFLRAFAMLLGLAVHAPLIFYEPTILREFGINEMPEAEEWIWILLIFITNWRMPLFFLLSGFFSVLIIQKRGDTRFLLDRTVRIGVTCLIFCLIYDYVDGRLDFTLGHLWFLFYLIIFVFVFSFIQKFQFVKKILQQTITSYKFLVLAILLIITVPLASVLNSGWNTYLLLTPPETFFELKPGNLVYYFSYFLMGSLLYSNQNLFTKLGQNKTLLSLTILSIVAFLFQLIESANPTAIHTLLIGINTLCWVLLFLGFATKLIKSRNMLLGWLVELSYPIYLLHLLPILIFSVELHKAGYSQINIFILSIIFGFGVSVFLYYLLIKFTPLNWLINGYRKSPFQLKILFKKN